MAEEQRFLSKRLHICCPRGHKSDLYLVDTEHIMSNSISKGREEKLSKHGTDKAQNRVKTFPNPSMHLSTWPNNDIPTQNEAAGAFREQK